MQDTRRRFKALAHLPLGCEFALVELDLAPLVSAATLREFRGTATTLLRPLRARERH